MSKNLAPAMRGPASYSARALRSVLGMCQLPSTKITCPLCLFVLVVVVVFVVVVDRARHSSGLSMFFIDRLLLTVRLVSVCLVIVDRNADVLNACTTAGVRMMGVKKDEISRIMVLLIRRQRSAIL